MGAERYYAHDNGIMSSCSNMPGGSSISTATPSSCQTGDALYFKRHFAIDFPCTTAFLAPSAIHRKRLSEYYHMLRDDVALSSFSWGHTVDTLMIQKREGAPPHRNPEVGCLQQQKYLLRESVRCPVVP